MAYEKTNWSSGDVITAEKLNHIESGVEAAGSSGGVEIYVVHGLYYWSDDSSSWVVTVTESYNDILSVCKSGKIVIMDLADSYGGHEMCQTYYVDDGEGYTQLTFYGMVDIDIGTTNVVIKERIVDYVDDNWKYTQKIANIPYV